MISFKNMNNFIHANKNFLKSIVGWIISIFCIGFLFSRIEIKAAVKSLTEFDLIFIMPALLSLFVGYSCRVLRWSSMLKEIDYKITTISCVAPFLGSIALNNVLPLRAGDIIRAFVFPSAMNITKSAAVSTLMFERLLDILILSLSLVLGMIASKILQLPEWIGNVSIALVLICSSIIFSIILFANYFSDIIEKYINITRDASLIKTLLEFALPLLKYFAEISTLKSMLKLVLLSIFVWAGEAGLFYFLLLGFNISASFATSLLVMGFITLSTMVPSSPGYVGPFHLAAVTVVGLLGYSSEIGASFAILSHLILWTSTTFCGGVLIILNPKLFEGVMPRSVL